MLMRERFRRLFVGLTLPFVTLRGPLFVALAGAVMLIFPSQTHEIYRALALSPESQMQQILWAYLSFSLAGLLIWYIARNVTLLWQRDRLQETTIAGFLLRWMPRFLGASPLFAAATGMLLAVSELPIIDTPVNLSAEIPGLLNDMKAAYDQVQSARSALKLGATLACVTGVVLMLLTFIRSFHRWGKYAEPNPLLFGVGPRSGFFIISVCLIVGLSLFFFSNPKEMSAIAGQFGALAIFGMFLFCLAFLVSFFANIYDRTGIHALWIIAIIAIGATALNLNDNHTMRTLDREMISIPSPEYRNRMRNFQVEEEKRVYVNAGKAFEAWLEKRPDRDYYKRRNRPYPVYVVSAQGGGLYAAYQSAMTLSRLQDRCKGFAQHVFAISGVSGGGLGAAVFSSLVRTMGKPVSQPDCAYGEATDNSYQEKAARFLSQDFMAPLTAAGFFPDFFQRFLPFPIARFDRARALEASFERAWDLTETDREGNLFAESFYDHWSPDGLAPALILNTTQMNTGRRFVFSPFHFRRQTSDRLTTFLQLTRRPVALSTAVGVSARFPWILPPASWQTDFSRTRNIPNPNLSQSFPFSKPGDRRRVRSFRFLDGGLFEYSGAETAIDIIQVIEDLQRSRVREGKEPFDIDVQQIILSDDEIVEDAVTTKNFRSRRAETTRSRGFGEILSPINAALNARLARANLSVTRIFDRQCPGCFRSRRDRRDLPGFDGRARLFRINHTDFSLTVGWQISPATQKLIAAHSGDAHKCFAAPGIGTKRTEWMVKVINENNCSACRIVYDLSLQPAAHSTQSLGTEPETNGDVPLNPYRLALPEGGKLLCQEGEARQIIAPLADEQVQESVIIQ